MKKTVSLLILLIISVIIALPCFADETTNYVISPTSLVKEQSYKLQRALRTNVYLPVKVMSQQPSLPNGCEITSLSMVLNYYGYDADKVDLYDNYLQHAELAINESGGYVGYDPNNIYVGDAKSEDFGFYCFSAPITKAANLYLTLNSTHANATNISGADSVELEKQLRHGQPVIVWATLTFEPLRRGQLFSWTMPSGEVYYPYANLHCIVLKGYDDENYYFSDPLYGEQIVKKQVFLDQYEALGSQAVTLGVPRGDTPLIRSILAASADEAKTTETVIS